MSRRKAPPKRATLPDPLFGSELVSRLINVLMLSGKKALAEKIMYEALQYVIDRAPKGKDEEGEAGGSSSGGNIRKESAARNKALKALELALENIQPRVEVKSRRVGGANYQVPVEVRAERKVALSMRWLVDYARQRGEKTMVLRLANELLDATQGRGGAVKKREEVHRMAKANQAFAHYRW